MHFLGQSPVKSPIIAHRRLCLDMFEGVDSISNLKIWFKRQCCLNILCVLFIKHVRMDV